MAIFSKIVSFLFWMSFCVWASAQTNTTTYVMGRSMGQRDAVPAAVELKWFTKDISVSGLVYIFRQDNQNGKWVRINDNPVVRQKSLSEQDKKQDEELEFLEYITQQKKTQELSGIILTAVWLKVFQNEAFARYMGVYYRDTTVQLGGTYQYKIVQMSGGIPKEIGISKIITVQQEAFVEAAPSGIQITSLKKSVGFKWEEEPTRFWATNVYRRQGSMGWVKVNTKPIVPFVRKDSMGVDMPKEYQYIEDSLPESQMFEYQIRGIDFFGKETRASSSHFVFVRDQTPPDAPVLRLDSIHYDRVYLSMSTVEVGDLSGFRVFRADAKETIYEEVTTQVLTGSSAVWVDKVPTAKHYYYKVTLTDTSGNSSVSDRIIVFVADELAPEVPLGLTIKPDSGRFIVQWKEVKDPDLMGYYVYRGGYPGNKEKMVKCTPLPLTQSLFIDTINKVTTSRFYYRIAAVDTNLNVSAWSDTISAQLPDNIPPDAPHWKQIQQRESTIYFEWISNREKDISFYTIWRNVNGEWEKIQEVPGREVYQSTLSVDYTGKALYAISATDGSGNQGALSLPFGCYTRKTILQYSFVIQKKKTPKSDSTISVLWIKELPPVGMGYVVQQKNSTVLSEWETKSGLQKDKVIKNKILQSGEYVYRLVWYYDNGEQLLSNEVVIQVKR
ncbi:MAG: hypothetical protein MUE33_12495 [Cytophagaceae bacterium]|nr:hypothetical protein [Cytophagaceae bacterium]